MSETIYCNFKNRYGYWSGIKNSRGYDFREMELMNIDAVQFLSYCSANHITKLTEVPEDVKFLFEKYKLTAVTRTGACTVTLPDNLLVSDEWDIKKLYWAESMVLSASIGLDFSALLSKSLDAEMYYIMEPVIIMDVPRYTKRAVVLRFDRKIVGAYLDDGYGELVAINSKTFEDVTGKKRSEFLTSRYIDKKCSLYESLSDIGPEELIKRFIETMDIRVHLSCESIDSMFYELCGYNSETDKNELFNDISLEDYPETVINITKNDDEKNGERDSYRVEFNEKILQSNMYISRNIYVVKEMGNIRIRL